MSTPLEDYGLIGDCETAALVGRDGSVDWLCLPRFDSAACFAALLGTPQHGRWRMAPAAPVTQTRRRYRGDTLILETEFATATGRVALIDFMPVREQSADLVRIVEGRAGVVPMEMELRIRFDYGSTIPWVERRGDVLVAIAGPDQLRLQSPVATHGENFTTRARFEVRAGQRLGFDLTWYPSHHSPPGRVDTDRALAATEETWTRWASRIPRAGRWTDAVVRSFVTLKALTYGPTGGLVAAATTSLPEQIGGVRNWDYRYCWVRDATFVLYALAQAGFIDEAIAWREWLLRAAAGTPSQIHIMYGLGGERRLPEIELDWLPGYEGSRPVRTGNAAHRQRQLDVYGELLDTMLTCRRAGWPPAPRAWHLERALVTDLERSWREPDEGIWEVRGPRRHFTHSKVMAWVAFDRAIKSAEQFGLGAPIARWRELRTLVHREVCERGYHQGKQAFVQSYGSDRLDASLLMIPLVGFLPASDPRVRGTVEAIERELLHDGFVRRYLPEPDVDGLPAGEGTFLLCTFWLADNLHLLGRQREAERVFERVLSVRNDLGLLSESYDADHRRLVGNFPQAFSHVGIVNTARNLSADRGPAEDRPA